MVAESVCEPEVVAGETGLLTVVEGDGGLLLGADVERVSRYADAATSEATGRAYRQDWAAWTRYAEERGLSILPADPLAVAAWLSALAEAGSPPSTITRRLTGVSRAHRDAGLTAPSEHEGLRRVMRGIRREAARSSVRPVKARAVDTATVRAHVEDLDTTTLAGLRDRCLLLVGFALGLRASDLVWLNVADLTPAATDGGLDVIVRFSKTDQMGAGETLALAPGVRAATCPVRAVGEWVEAAALTDGPLLRSVGKGATARVGAGRMATSSVARILARAAGRAGVPTAALSPHSLRRGYATSAYAAGVSEREIARTGRWRSVTVMRGYDASSRWADPASGRLGL
jgi:site-specific recombinase XerD